MQRLVIVSGCQIHRIHRSNLLESSMEEKTLEDMLLQEKINCMVSLPDSVLDFESRMRNRERRNCLDTWHVKKRIFVNSILNGSVELN